MEKINHRAIQLSGSSHLMLKSLFCPIDLRIATRCRESEFPPTELMRLEANTRTCAAIAHVRGFDSKLVRLKEFCRPISVFADVSTASARVILDIGFHPFPFG